MKSGSKNSYRRHILLLFCLSGILVAFNISALIATIPSIARSLNQPAGDVAGIVAYYMIPYGLCALIYAHLATKYSVRWIMILSSVLFAVGSGICLLSDNMTIILTGRVIAGIAAASVTPMALMTLGKVFDKKVHGRVIGLFFGASFFGSTLGLILTEFATWHWLFIVPTVLGVFVAIAFAIGPRQGMEANLGVKVNYLHALQIKGLRRILILIFLMSMFFHGVCKWYGVFLDHIYGFNQQTISFIIILTAIAGSIGQMLGGVITDKIGRKNACYIGIAMVSVMIMALYGHYNIVLLATVLCMISIGWTIAHNGISTILTDFSAGHRAELAALNSAVRFFSGGIGFWISGNFVQKNYGLTFLIIGFLMSLLILLVPQISVQRKEI